MPLLRRAAERLHTRLPWLDSRHAFSFGEHWDPEWRGWSVLRVFNDDRVSPARGFATHAHRDMEILSWVLAGALEHKDSMGHGSVIRPGDAQRLSAGAGITHSEWNHSNREPVHFLQIWIQPDRRGGAPSYAERHFSEAERRGRWCLIASPGGEGGSIPIQQAASMYATLLADGEALTYTLPEGRSCWLHLAHGSASCAGFDLLEGDALGFEDVTTIELVARGPCEALLLDLP